jgi:hypothetical protein
MQRDSSAQVEAERRRKAAIYARHAGAMDRRASLQRWRRRLSPLGLAIVIGLSFVLVLWLVSPYAPSALIRAYPLNCVQARAMGHGNASIGTPGYFAHLDRDRDGTSCEPWAPAWRMHQ